MTIPVIQNNNMIQMLMSYFSVEEIQKGIKVSVYFNLHKKLFSVRSRNKKNYGLVLFHTDKLNLLDVNFNVRETSRLKVIKTKRKNVHAFCDGRISCYIDLNNKGRMITYNPYKMAHFSYLDDLSPVRKTNKITMEVINKKGFIWECHQSGTN